MLRFGQGCFREGIECVEVAVLVANSWVQFSGSLAWGGLCCFCRSALFPSGVVRQFVRMACVSGRGLPILMRLQRSLQQRKL